MANKQLIMGIIRFSHDFFTVVWIGGLGFMVLTMFSSFKKVLGKDPKAQSLMNAITRRHSIWVYISIVGLFVTGLLLGRSNANYLGFMSFDNLYSSLTSAKHIITFVMILIALFRSISFGRKDIKMSPEKSRFSMLLIIINFSLGLVILFLSGLLASI